MKKIALTSLMAVFAVSGAHAANVIDGNPLYMPGQNHFYSVTDVYSHTNNDTPWSLGEEFGYGITDRLAINLETSLTENKEFDEFSVNGLGANLAFRAVNMGGWKLDAVAGYGFTGVYKHPEVAGRDAWFNKDNTKYTWMAGVRGGYVASNWTLATKALFEYTNTKSFNWDADKGQQGVHALVLGVDGQYVLCKHLSLVAGAEYTGIMDDEWYGDPADKVKNEGTWAGEFGVNYNIDSTKFVGAYVNGSLNHHEGTKANKWGWDEGFGFGVKFGIDF